MNKTIGVSADCGVEFQDEPAKPNEAKVNTINSFHAAV